MAMWRTPQHRGFTRPSKEADKEPPYFHSEEYLASLVHEIVPDDAETLRYWPARKEAPPGWRDVAAIGPHLYRGKIIVKVDD